MLERFTKRGAGAGRARAVRSRSSRGPARSVPSTCSPRCCGTTSASPYACWTTRARRRERLHAELDRRRARYVDGLDDEDAAALESIGIDLEEVVRPDSATSRRCRSGRGVPGRHGGSPAPSKKVLELALREAIALQHNYIGTEHLLLGLVREGDVIVRDTLLAAGVDTTHAARRRSQEAVAPSAASAHPPG